MAACYDANRIRAASREESTIPVILGRRVEAMFYRLKDFRRIATRYDKRG